jgi:hypothetical protein
MIEFVFAASPETIRNEPPARRALVLRPFSSASAFSLAVVCFPVLSSPLEITFRPDAHILAAFGAVPRFRQLARV